MTLNDLVEKIKEGAVTAGEFAARTATCAGKKAGEMYNTSKHQISIFDLKNDISDLYKEIGELVYATHRTGEDTKEEIEKRFASIDEKQKKIEELRDLIDDIKEEQTCASCGAKNEKDAEFCKKCGTKL